MDQNRQISLLIPPFFFFASLLLGAHFDPEICVTKILWDKIGLYITISGISILPLGFLIGTISILFLRAVFLVFNFSKKYKNVTYESFFTEDFIKEQIWPKLKMDEDLYDNLPKSKYYSKGWMRKKLVKLLAVVTYEHLLLNCDIHDWLIRRWSAFYVCINSITALAISLILGTLYFSIQFSKGWFGIIICIIILFLISGIIAFIERIEMVEFQLRRRVKIEAEVSSESKDTKKMVE